MLKIMNNDYGFWANKPTEHLSTTQFKRIDRIVKQKTEELSDLEYQLGILKRERFSIYCNNVFYMCFMLIEDAKKWHYALKSGVLDGEKIDKRKRYKEKDNYNYTVNELEELIGHKVEITGFSNIGLSNHANAIYFTSEGHKWYLEIPVVKNISLKTFEDYDIKCFQIYLGNCDEDHHIGCVGTTFIEDELKDIFEKGLEKYGNKH